MIVGVALLLAFGLEAQTGSAFNVPTPLTIRQSGEPTLHLTAHYETRPFTGHAPYYAWRIWYGRWEFEFLHHKLYLTRRPPEIQEFAITHGFNVLLANHVWQKDGAIFRTGGGLIVSRPETEVRGRRLEGGGFSNGFNDGYYLTGIAAQGTVGKRFPLFEGVHAVIEAKVTAGFARVPVRGGSADVPHLAFHALAGLGWGR